eukprot:TRINITY_DN263_c5_g4_i1.p1 TRINITY_DN263_c5_g4~~TRINITY_DN263_c5_g4_i1.p1  ORF type:complete len:752 (+),score=135.37 TRINITY_DN263_c5_g4_i1:344-2599(+)
MSLTGSGRQLTGSGSAKKTQRHLAIDKVFENVTVLTFLTRCAAQLIGADEDHNDVTKAIAGLAFRNGPNAVKKLVSACIREEFWSSAESCQDQDQSRLTLFRTDSVFVSSLTHVMRLCCNAWLRVALKTPMNELRQASVVLNVDPSREAASPEVFARRKEKLTAIVEGFLESVYSSLSDQPFELWDTLRLLASSSQLCFGRGKQEEARAHAVGGFLFLRIICPQIIQVSTKVSSKKNGSNATNTVLLKNSVLVAKIIQSVANFAPRFEEEHMRSFDTLLHEQQAKLLSHFAKVLSPKYGNGLTTACAGKAFVKATSRSSSFQCYTEFSEFCGNHKPAILERAATHTSTFPIDFDLLERIVGGGGGGGGGDDDLDGSPSMRGKRKKWYRRGSVSNRGKLTSSLDGTAQLCDMPLSQQEARSNGTRSSDTDLIEMSGNAKGANAPTRNRSVSMHRQNSPLTLTCGSSASRGNMSPTDLDSPGRQRRASVSFASADVIGELHGSSSMPYVFTNFNHGTAGGAIMEEPTHKITFDLLANNMFDLSSVVSSDRICHSATPSMSSSSSSTSTLSISASTSTSSITASESPTFDNSNVYLSSTVSPDLTPRFIKRGAQWKTRSLDGSANRAVTRNTRSESASPPPLPPSNMATSTNKLTSPVSFGTSPPTSDVFSPRLELGGIVASKSANPSYRQGSDDNHSDRSGGTSSEEDETRSRSRSGSFTAYIKNKLRRPSDTSNNDVIVDENPAGAGVLSVH